MEPNLLPSESCTHDLSESLTVTRFYPTPLDLVGTPDGDQVLVLGCLPVFENQRPDPEYVRNARCPECGEEIVSSLYYVGGKGYECRWECWDSLKEDAKCTYSKTL